MAELSPEEFAGGGDLTPSSSLEKGNRSPANPAEMSPEDFMGSNPLSAANLVKDNRSQLVRDVTGYDTNRSILDNTLGNLKKAGGEAAALADFVLSLPGFMINVGGQVGGTIQAAARGVPLRADQSQLNPVTAYGVGREAGQTLAEPFMNPMKKLLDRFQSGKVYEDSKTSKGMEKLTTLVEDAGKWTEEATGGKIARDSVPMLVDTLMAGAIGVGAKTADAARLEQTRSKLREQALELKKQAEAEIADATLSPEQFAVRAPVQQQINDVLGIKTPQERAAEARKRRQDVQSAFRAPAEGSDYGSIEESQFRADERTRNSEDFAAQAARQEAEENARHTLDTENLPPSPERVTQAEILRIMQKPGHERTAEDLITLREARKQEGSSLPGGAKLAIAAGVPAALAMQDDDIKAIAAQMAEDFGGPAGAVGAMFIPVFKGAPNVKRAEALLKSGKPRAEVWKETGLFQGKDGVWRQELTDHPSQLVEGLERNQFDKELIAGPSIFKPKKLSDIVDHPELYRLYPELKDAQVKSTGFSFDISGAFDDKNNTFYLAGGTPENVRSVLLHEIQHYIQHKANMARGGNTNQFLRPEVQQFRKELREEWDGLRKRYPELKDVNPYTLANALEKQKAGKHIYDFEEKALQAAQTIGGFHEIAKNIMRRRALDQLDAYAYKQYKRLGGEVEARAVQKRADMTPEERKATPPWESFDVPEDQFIVQQSATKSRTSSLQAAVKSPGGMWHPEAVERLARPLTDRLEPTLNVPEGLRGEKYEELRANSPEVKWGEKAIRNYLNKYAGTERDPLKDVEIPFGEGTKSWGKLWDAAVGKANKEGILENKPGNPDGVSGGTWNYFPEVEKAQPGEMIHQFGDFVGGSGKGSAPAITSYLSHVGDYLRQNVKPEDLQRYDLVRAVRETAENDKRVAKAMEKAQAASTKDLPVYKEYPDGFRWVELKLPEKLTEEQKKQVRPMTKAEIEQALAADHDYPAGSEAGYVAIDAQGKPIRNAYTGDLATHGDPEGAWLAGRLAEEGNSMGHCVGGYCPSVASGESRIFSLRDPKGASHVTVEVSPTERLIDPQVIAKHITENHPELHGKVARMLREADPSKDMALVEKLKSDPEIAAVLEKDYPLNIDQIKGKLNRAPNKEYLPYVQDFVRSGKWGEVGDLGNTGLHDIEQSKRNSEPYAKLAEEFHPGQRYLTEEEFSKLQQEGTRRTLAERKGPKGEQGKVDAQTVLGLSALGLGGLVGSVWADDPAQGALLGALAGFALSLPGTRERLKNMTEVADYGLGILSTRIGSISEQVKLRAREYEMRNLTESHAYLHQVAPWMKEVTKLPKEEQQKLAIAVMNGDREGLLKIMQGNRPLVEAWRSVRGTLNELGDKLQGRGRFKAVLDDYFPRLVKDVEGLKRQLDGPVRERIEAQLFEADKEAQRKRGSGLTDIERSAIINREIQGYYRTLENRPGFTKARRIEEISKGMLPYYYTPQEALFAYVRGAVQDLEMARFFGKDTVEVERNGQRFINVDQSIGNLVGRELKEGKITSVQAQEMIGLLHSRFDKGDLSPWRVVQSVRNLANVGLLGNIVSAATQIGDIAMPIYAQGFRSTLTALARQLSGRAKVTAQDFGLADHVAEEFVGQTKTATVLNKMLKASGFSAIDRMGKTTMLNAAHDKLTRQAMNDSPALARKYQEAFGNEYPSLVKDLRDGKLTNRVRLALFSELSDFQPISKMEVPQAYLDHPNGRLVYMLKTFMLKQMDVIRRDAYQEIKAGNVGRGLANLTGYAALLGISGAATDVVKNWLMGRPISFQANDIAENILKTFGWSSYTLDKAKKHPIQTAAGMFMPPFQIMDHILTADPKAVQYIPLIGKLWYNWELGGREEAELREARQAKKKGQDYNLSPRAEQYRDRKRELAKEKRGG